LKQEADYSEKFQAVSGNHQLVSSAMIVSSMLSDPIEISSHVSQKLIEYFIIMT